VPEFNKTEQKLIDRSREKIVSNAEMRRNKNLFDVLYAFAISESGEIYMGKPFESNHGQFDFCAERHAINQMQLRETEKSRLKAILVAGPVPDSSHEPTMPCGACRHAIQEFGTEQTSVIVSNFVRTNEDWEMFPVKKRFKPNELYPEAYEPIDWDRDQ